MLHDRKRLSTALTAVAAFLALCLVPAAPAAAEPTLEEVKDRVERLYRNAEIAQERAHDARLELRGLRRELEAARAAQARHTRRVDRAQYHLEESVVRQYEGEEVAAVSGVLVSEDPADFLDQLTTMAALTDAQADLFDDYAVALRAVELQRREASGRVAEMAGVEERLSRSERRVEQRLGDAEELLAELEEEQRVELMAADAPNVAMPANVPASGGAAAAVQYALAQVGDAYVYGASGPNAFDCSGLTSMAWAQGGVALPRSSGAQAGSGPSVSSSSLQPGDLVFYYSPISHVGLYIGNGLIAHAANPGTGVAVAGVFSMPFSGAVRPG